MSWRGRSRALTGSALAWLVLAGGVGAACEQAKERDPAICLGRCGTAGPGGSGVPSDGGRSGDGSEGGQGGQGSGVTLVSSVLLLNDLDFKNGSPFADRVAMRAPKEGGGSVTGSWDGNEPFRIENVAEARATWVLGTPDTALNNDALPTLEPMRTDRPDADGEVEADPFALVRASTMENIYDLLTVPVTLDESRAQIVLRVVTGTGTGFPGIRVTATTAETIAYAASGAFSDAATETDATGLVVLANIAASSWPGSLVSVSFAGARTGATELRVVSGAVTLVPVEP